jgi:aminoglycoside phosphotransferase (APT) family kinase protein
MLMSKSRIYKEITADDINKISKDLYGSDTSVLEYSILKGGLFNTTYYVKTDKDDDGIVVRVGPVNRHLLFEFEKDMMPEEPFFHELYEKHGIPTSRILKYVPFGEVIDREYIISRYMYTVPMNDPLLNDTDLGYVYEEAGALTNRIHGITNYKFGWKRKAGWGEYSKWSDFVIAFSKEAADKAEHHGLFTGDSVMKFRELFKDNFYILDEVKTPYMVHTDLWQGNILLKSCSGRLHIAGIIDLDRTIFGDKYWDLVNPWMINDSFIKGYREETPKTENHEKRCSLYKLLNGFFASYVCLIEYDDANWFNREKSNALDILNRL